jgi:hypothetical protein
MAAALPAARPATGVKSSGKNEQSGLRVNVAGFVCVERSQVCSEDLGPPRVLQRQAVGVRLA